MSKYRTLLNRFDFSHIRIDCPIKRDGTFVGIIVPAEILLELDDEDGIELVCYSCNHYHQVYVSDESELRVRTY